LIVIFSPYLTGLTTFASRCNARFWKVAKKALKGTVRTVPEDLKVKWLEMTGKQQRRCITRKTFSGGRSDNRLYAVIRFIARYINTEAPSREADSEIYDIVKTGNGGAKSTSKPMSGNSRRVFGIILLTLVGIGKY
jgi:hypothetical protein